MSSFDEVFAAVKEYCKERLVLATYNLFIDGIEPVSFEGSVATLSVRSDFVKGIVETRYKDLLREAFKELLGFDIDVELTIPAPVEQAPAEVPGGGNYEFTFENFIVGSTNKFAHAAAQAVAANPSGAYNPLFIWGGSGLGKTHLLGAIQFEIHKNFPDYNIVYVDGEKFTNEIISAIHDNTTAEFHNKYRAADVLLVDDIQFIGGKESTQEEFFHTFNDPYNAGKQIVLTSDIAPSKISKLQNRILTRFSLGVQVDVTPPDFETRMAIVKKKADMLDLQLSDNVVRIIAEKIKTNIRQLEGTVNKIKALTIYTNESPSISMAQRIIKEIIIENHPAEITVDRILQEVAAAFDVTADDIKSTNRRANVSLARKIAIYLFKDVKGMTFIQIGNELNKNHSTMTIHYQDVVKNLKENKQLKDTVDDIIKNLKDN